MTAKDRPAREGKPVIVKDAERCEATSAAGHVGQHRCIARGDMYSISGGVTMGFARLCKRHAATFSKAGFKVESITPLETHARSAVGL